MVKYRDRASGKLVEARGFGFVGAFGSLSFYIRSLAAEVCSVYIPISLSISDTHTHVYVCLYVHMYDSVCVSMYPSI